MAETEKQTRIRKAIIAIANRHGQLDADLVIRAAKNPRSVLHDQFEWDVEVAARKHWIDVANRLIRTVTLTVINKDIRVIIPSYVRDPSVEPNKKGMISLTSDLINEEYAQQIILRELKFCESAIARARGVAGILDKKCPGTSDQLENMLQALIAARDLLKAA